MMTPGPHPRRVVGPDHSGPVRDPLADALVGDPIALARIGVCCTARDAAKVKRLTRRARRRMRVADWWMARAKRHTLRAQRILLGYTDAD